MHAYIHTHIHTYIHPYIHTYMYKYTQHIPLQPQHSMFTWNPFEGHVVLQLTGSDDEREDGRAQKMTGKQPTSNLETHNWVAAQELELP